MDLFFHYLAMPYLLWGITVTLDVTCLGLGGGLLIGVVLAAMQLSRFALLAGFGRTYAVIFRGTPLILQLVFAYDALPHLGLKLTPLMAGGLALAANEAPFIAEILRSGIRGVEQGQITAGEALGMTPAVLMRRIIAPQAIRTMVPALGNEAVTALKNSSLASVIAVQELTLRSTQLASSTFDFFSIFFASGVMYLALAGAFSLAQILAEIWLDLDRPPMRERLLRLLPWRDARTVTPRSVQPRQSAEDLLQEPIQSASVTISAQDRALRLEALAERVPAVEVRNLAKSYGDHTIFNDLDITVRSGEVVALLGPSGSGKSTLLRCISRLETWDSGTVHVGGRRLGYSEDGVALGPRDLARERADIGVGMVFQQFNLFGHLSARENVAGPLRWVHGISAAEADLRAMALLDRVGLAERADALPRHLSGGQQQRVAIARALAPNPSVLLLDEPTSALDPERVDEVLDVVRRLAIEDGLTMMISTHQLRFARDVADRVVFLSGGRIMEEGWAHDIFTRPRHPLTARFLRVMGVERPLGTVA
jgi:polar amino acid transport system permease protein